MNKRLIYIPLYSIIILLIIVGCSPKSSYDFLSFIFDGVPNPYIEEEVIDTIPEVDTVTAEVRKEALPMIVFHPPYEQNKCTSCHDKSVIGRLVSDPPELCYQCHDSYHESKPFIHGPVQSGHCTACHNPHKSQKRTLLRLVKQELCFNCHESKQVFENKVHESIGERNCTDCHNPHHSYDIDMLKPDLCYECHEDFAYKFNHLHGPVNGGFCSTCHDRHISEEKFNLRRTGQDLCMYCHETTQVFANKEHEFIDDADCTECHNPHGGEDKFMIN